MDRRRWLVNRLRVRFHRLVNLGNRFHRLVNLGNRFHRLAFRFRLHRRRDVLRFRRGGRERERNSPLEQEHEFPERRVRRIPVLPACRALGPGGIARDDVLSRNGGLGRRRCGGNRFRDEGSNGRSRWFGGLRGWGRGGRRSGWLARHARSQRRAGRLPAGFPAMFFLARLQPAFSLFEPRLPLGQAVAFGVQLAGGGANGGDALRVVVLVIGPRFWLDQRRPGNHAGGRLHRNRVLEGPAPGRRRPVALEAQMRVPHAQRGTDRERM